MHKPVLLKESVDGLDLKEGEVFLDGTFGGGGHSREVRKRFGDKVRIIALDQDPLVREKNPDFEVRTLNFREMDSLGESPDAILLDIGLSSDQLETSGRGFSFQKDEPLDMRMSQTGLSAAEILNSWDESAIELILRGFGEERLSKKIAREVVARREEKPFSTTGDLVEAVLAVKPKSFRDPASRRRVSASRGGKIHPATKTFQALRIAVNEELTALEEGLEKGFKLLNPKGRFAVISFHSLEDRIVKNYFRKLSQEGLGEILTKKPITSNEEELSENPRARSAKLRIIKRYE